MKYTIKQLQDTPESNGMLEDGYLIALREFVNDINRKLKDIEFTLNNIEPSEDCDVDYAEHFNQLVGRREQLNELKSLLKGEKE